MSVDLVHEDHSLSRLSYFEMPPIQISTRVDFHAFFW